MNHPWKQYIKLDHHLHFHLNFVMIILIFIYPFTESIGQFIHFIYRFINPTKQDYLKFIHPNLCCFHNIIRQL